MRVSKKSILILTLIVAFGLMGAFLFGCKKSGPVGDVVVVIGTTEKVTDLDPAETYDFHTWEIFQNIGATLLVYEPGTDTLIPGLAKEMPTVSDDKKEWTFKLRDGLLFSDGTPCDANAIKFSIDRVIATKGDPSWLVDTFVDHVEVIDATTVKFVLKDPIAYFPSLVATIPYTPANPNVYPATEVVTDPSNLPAVSTGPYMVENYVRDVEMALVPNPNYYGDKPMNTKVILKYYKDATTLRLAVENGEIDIAWKALNPTDIADLKEKPNLKTIEANGAQIRYLCFTCSTDPFKDKVLRAAVSAAVDRKTIVEKVFLSTVEPLYSMVPIGMFSHKDSFLTAYGEYNVDKAKELLATLGYNETNPFTFDLWYTPTHYGDTEADVALLIKQGLEATGVMKVNLKSAEWGSYTDNFDLANMSVFLLGWYPDYIDPDDYTSVFALSTASDSMGIYYADAKMDELLLKAQVTVNEKERKAIYEEVQDYWATEAPTCPIFQGKLFLVTQPNVSGIKIGTTMIFNYKVIEKK